VDELADSSGVLDDPAILRRRLAEAGYLFFRGLLPDGTLWAPGAAVLARLRDGGRVGEVIGWRNLFWALSDAMAARPNGWTSREVILS
jgi:hypothetical protein